MIQKVVNALQMTSGCFLVTMKIQTGLPEDKDGSKLKGSGVRGHACQTGKINSQESKSKAESLIGKI